MLAKVSNSSDSMLANITDEHLINNLTPEYLSEHGFDLIWDVHQTTAMPLASITKIELK